MQIPCGGSWLVMDLYWWEKDVWESLQEAALWIGEPVIVAPSPTGPLPVGLVKAMEVQVHRGKLDELEEIVKDLTGLLHIAQSPLQVSSCSASGQELQTTLCQLRSAVGFVHKTFKAFAEVATCPLTHTTFKRPLLAPDGNTYEKSFIVKWLRFKGVSPVTREPMREEELLRNRALEQMLAVMPHVHEEEFDEDESEEDVSETELHDEIEQELPLEVPGVELVTALQQHNEELALELALGPLDLAVLNGRHGEHKETVLHLALLHMLPAVALALVDRGDFAAYGAYMETPDPSFCALHLAAALGYSDVCEVFFQRGGVVFAGIPVLADSRITLSNGDELHFQQGDAAADIARRYSRLDLLPMIDAAAQEMGDFSTELHRRIAAFEADGHLPRPSWWQRFWPII